MKQKIFLSVVMVLGLPLYAADGDGVSRLSQLAAFVCERVPWLFTPKISQEEAIMHFDKAFKEQDVQGIKRFGPYVPQEHKRSMVDALFEDSLYDRKLFNRDPTDRDRLGGAHLFLHNLISRDHSPKQEQLIFYITFFIHTLPNKRGGPCGNCDDDEQPVLKQLVHHAATFANLAALTCLVDRFGALVTVYHRDSFDRGMPLHAAVARRVSANSEESARRIACMKLLLEHGADLQAINRNGATALQLAVKNGAWRETAFLLHHPKIWDLSAEELNYAKAIWRWENLAAEPTDYQLMENRYHNLWKLALSYGYGCGDMDEENRLPMMRLLRACDIPVQQELLLATLKQLDGYSRPKLPVIKCLYKTIISQHSDFKVTVEYLESIDRLPSEDNIRNYIESCIPRKKLRRYKNRVGDRQGFLENSVKSTGGTTNSEK